MRLIGGYASPFVRRVGITLHLYGIPFDHDPVDTESRTLLEPYSPIGRIPALVLDGGANKSIDLFSASGTVSLNYEFQAEVQE